MEVKDGEVTGMTGCFSRVSAVTQSHPCGHAPKSKLIELNRLTRCEITILHSRRILLAEVLLCINRTLRQEHRYVKPHSCSVLGLIKSLRYLLWTAACSLYVPVVFSLHRGSLVSSQKHGTMLNCPKV